MVESAVAKIAEIRRKAEDEIKVLRIQAVQEIAERISTIRQELGNLEAQYAQLTGKAFPAGANGSHHESAAPGRRRRSAEEKASLSETVRGLLAAHPAGVAMRELVRATRTSVSAVREALAKIQTKTTGQKSGTRYFLK
jgi:uncharacterized small protein (DUF1192 family)